MIARLALGCALLTSAAFAASLLGCGSGEPVCEGMAGHYVVLPFASPSDLELSQELTPDVAREVAQRAVVSCGSIAAGVVAGRSARNLEIRRFSLKSDLKTLVNPKPWRKGRREKVDRFLEHNLLAPVREAVPTAGSPFLGALAQTALEVESRGWPQGTVVLIGDSIARERSPSGRRVNFRVEVPEDVLDEFVPLLRGLHGHCVMVVGQGGSEDVPSADVVRARELLEDTLTKAGVRFLATRSRDLPSGCPD